MDADILEAARALAAAEGRSMGRVISDLARRGLRPGPAPADVDEEGFPVFAVPPDAPVITGELVNAVLEED